MNKTDLVPVGRRRQSRIERVDHRSDPRCGSAGRVSQQTARWLQPSPDTRLDAFYQLIEMGSGNTSARSVLPPWRC